MSFKTIKTEYTNFQLASLVALRFVIGWHFLYEGMAKITNPEWSADIFLNDAHGILSGFFQWLASDVNILSIVDFINVWALTFTGLFLIAGIFVRISGYAGVVLLSLYYLAAPPWPGLDYTISMAGNYLIINNNIIELAALLLIIAFPTSQIVGLERLIIKKGNEVSDA